MAMKSLVLTLLGLGAFATNSALACGPDALGTARTLRLKHEYAAYGTAQHAPLPLGPKEVVLTFDDGPRPESTPKVLAALREECAQATFFMVGNNINENNALAQEVRAEGHSVGMHSFTHPHLAGLSEADQDKDMAAMRLAYDGAFHDLPRAYRFPFLEETPHVLKALEADQITVMSVDLGIDDWLPDQSPEILTQRLISRLDEKGGGIILMHDGQDQTADALPMILKALKAHGYRVVHIVWE
jgi:peptidoglycan/xylan/chitin deacetylase (PgdA/CDA1 family)